jgi:hypothetical protein
MPAHGPGDPCPKGSRQPDGRGILRDMVLISERPAEVEDRAVPGHWEGDLVVGKRMTAIGTLVERSTRYVLLFALPEGHTADKVRPATAKQIRRLAAELRRSLTLDQGREFAEHVAFSVDTGAQVYVCDPRAAGLEREHQRPSASVLPPQHRPLGALPGPPQRRGSSAQLSGLDKRSAGSHHQRHWPRCCADR